jgi:short subunit dehydrogenase-like uncharacterized protein
MSTAKNRPFDVIVFGATSFVGQILCKHLVDRHGTGGSLRWAISGRNKAKLADVAAATGADVEQIVADANDADAMAELADSAQVIISTVGPYALYGSELVAAVAAAGTDYCDLTGEPQWMRRMIDAHQETAVASGARIVHTAGFDSIPSDLGVLYTQQRASEVLGTHCTRIAMRVHGAKGGASGGTLASMINMMDEIAAEPTLRKELANPYSLAPEGMRDGVKQPSVTIPANDELSGQWVAPFVMAAVNTKVVLRSHALAGHPWGEDFLYDEAMVTGGGPLGAVKAGAMVGGLGGFMGLSAIGPVRKLLATKVLPQPGSGPSPKAQLEGFFDIRFYGETADGQRIVTKVTGDRDPGYGSTAKMLGETAAVLVDPGSSAGGGFHTPASALGEVLIEALIDDAGLTFDVLE